MSNLCECGCGQSAAEGKRFIRGHQLKLKVNRVRLNCSSHCSVCGEHFTGTAAFDAHLKRINSRMNQHGAPVYDLVHLLPEEAGLEVAVENGHCDLATPEVSGIRVYRLPLGIFEAETA